ncbi:hypothetical protein BJY24_007399 [Nocardia transvalensis]|uniref:Pyridoxamine 5'-phosphate oxidase-like protein n=1 Tax=Nocardia transvalensis TaxID=37333 RepID=A0A7W9PLS0_9NOCA|nr:pyridoxamine 5'-phosphate oxidase family protein [Nocardia transvalensis]MBB5918487.1 hypothetical protein [Nocardia transvalensis]
MPSFTDTHALSDAESLRRLGDISFGRIVYHRHALPTIQPVSHIVDAGVIFVHAEPHTLTLTPHRQAVAYEADTIDPATHAGWCVTVVGFAEDLTTRDIRTPLQHLLDVPHPHRVIRIRPEFITGTEYGPALHPIGNPGPESTHHNPSTS